MFSLVLLVFLALVLIFQSMHGLFSALIMTVLTVCCAAVALGTFEYVAVTWLMDLWRADYAYPLALALTFGVPLLVLRVVMDQLITRSCLLPAIVDRVGGGICGLVTALTVVGIFALTAQMIPFERGNIFGYSRILYNSSERDPEDPTDNPEPADPYEEHNLFLTPDSFVTGLASLLSDGVFSGRKGFRENHPHFVQAVGWANAVPAEVQRLAPPDSISILETGPIEVLYEYTRASRRAEPSYEPVQPEGGKYYRRVRVKLSSAARDERKNHVFTLRQFRLVGHDRPGGPLTHYFAIGLQAEEDPTKYVNAMDHRYGKWPVIDMIFSPRGNSGEIDVVYELPRGFQPEYLEYKMAARAVVNFKGPDAEENDGSDFGSPRASAGPTPGTASPQAPSSSHSTVPSTQRAGRVRGATVRVGQSHFGDRLPLTMTAYQRYKNAELSRGMLVDGHLVGYLADQANGRNEWVSKFEVPLGQRLLHLNVHNLRARSTYGKALASAVKSAQNYTVQDDNGKRYQIVGKYAVARVGDDEVFEVQYFSHQAGSMGGVGKFEKIQDRHLTREYELVLLFLVDPGVTIVQFSTGGSASRADDLSNEGLVSPD